MGFIAENVSAECTAEKVLEQDLVMSVRKMGGLAFKFVSPGNSGVPDRILIMPGGRVIFVELKTKYGKLTALQTAQIRRMRRQGAEVFVICGSNQMHKFVKELKELYEGEER